MNSPNRHNPNPDPTPNKTQLTIDDSDLKVVATNYCRLQRTTEEFVVEMGIAGVGSDRMSVKLHTSSVMSPQSAKRLMLQLGTLIQDFESNFGEIEVIKQPINPEQSGPTDQ